MSKGGVKSYRLDLNWDILFSMGLVQGASVDNIHEITKNVIKTIAEGFLSLNTGWVLDANKHTDTSIVDPILLNTTRTAYPDYAVFFRHQTNNVDDGAKLMLNYCYDGPSVAITSAQSLISNFNTDLGFCLIPKGSDLEFGSERNSIIPNNTKFMGFGSDWSYLYGFAKTDSRFNENISYIITSKTDGSFVSVFIKNNSKIQMLCAGNMIQPFNTSDTGYLSSFCYRSFTQLNTDIHDLSNTDSGWASSNQFLAWYLPNGNLNALSNNIMDGLAFPGDFSNDNTVIKNGTYFSRPLIAYGKSTIGGAYDIIPNENTIKGYLNPEIGMLLTNKHSFSVGDIVDGGNYVYMGNNCLMPWDPSNDPSTNPGKD